MSIALIVSLSACAPISALVNGKFTPPWEPYSGEIGTTKNVVEKNYDLGVKKSSVVGDPMLRVKLSSERTYYQSQDPRAKAWGTYVTQNGWTPKYNLPQNEEGDYIITNPSFVKGVIGVAIHKDGTPISGDPVVRLDYAGSETAKYPLTTISDQLFKLITVDMTSGGAFNFELLYSGKTGNNINITYREYSGNNIRDKFQQELTYDLSESDTIQFRSIKIKVTKATNSNITFTVTEDGVDEKSAAYNARQTNTPQQPSSQNSGNNCQLITVKYIETAPWNVGKYLQKETQKNGGNKYTVLSSTPLSIISANDSVGTSFEIYNCN